VSHVLAMCDRKLVQQHASQMGIKSTLSHSCFTAGSEMGLQSRKAAIHSSRSLYVLAITGRGAAWD
jgi:hypothetical protein